MTLQDFTGISVIVLLVGALMMIIAYQPDYYRLENYGGTEDKMLKDAVDHALRDALDSAGIAVPEDFARGLGGGESPTIL